MIADGDRSGDYDGNLPGNAVIIHEVNPGRSEPAWLVDPVDPANGGDEGAMWRVGETFEDAAHEISVEVVASTTDGFQVKITYGASGMIFSDGFESGDVDKWSSAG